MAVSDEGSTIIDAVKDLAPISPSVAITGVTVLGFSLNEWVYIATILYTIVGIACMIKKHWFTHNNGDNNKQECGEHKNES